MNLFRAAQIGLVAFSILGSGCAPSSTPAVPAVPTPGVTAADKAATSVAQPLPSASPSAMGRPSTVTDSRTADLVIVLSGDAINIITPVDARTGTGEISQGPQGNRSEFNLAPGDYFIEFETAQGKVRTTQKITLAAGDKRNIGVKVSGMKAEVSETPIASPSPIK